MLDLEKIKERRKATPPSMFGGVYMTFTRTADLDALIAEVERLREGLNLWIAARGSDQCALGKARGERDRWHDAATVLSVEFAKIDDQRIAACEKLALLRRDREKLIVAIGELQKEVRDSRRPPFPQAGEPVLCGDDNDDATAFFLGSVPPRFGKSQERDSG